MDFLADAFSRFVTQLADRVDGPLRFRLVVMPTVVTILAILADRRDAREGRPARLGAFFMDRQERRRLFRSGLKDVGRVMVVAVILDTTYQLLVLRWLYPGQVLIVAVVCAVVPYVLVRGPITRIIRMVVGRRILPLPQPAAEVAATGRSPAAADDPPAESRSES